MAQRQGGTALTRTELDSWRVFVETTDELRATLAGRLQADSGISAGDYRVLLELSEAPDRRMRSSHLADAIGWERSRLSHHLGRMEKRGLIRREAAAGDNRGAQAVLTDEGRTALRRSSVPHFHAIRELFLDALTPAQLAAARDVAETLRGHLDALKADGS
ncbi:DNA-binding transcriptional regulator, MarR family [Glycomyces sambucus]|uniref:DNA-binding transcriptional regulator, MarR family n=1 Tax=Glycomyces sambucus TaxID=380244 RepID=A0A1G9I5C7_9ACTN|nr:MarR family transcriptional regulator [Glycomyces sambucus]SDL20255.1 DNA-binding transcriptional regulator, MarR family [Glycomyces sambucus]